MTDSTVTASPLKPTTDKVHPFVKIITIVSTLGGLLFGYDTGVIAGALLFMKTELGLTPFTTGLVTASLLFGAAIGAFTAGRLADAIGRRNIIIRLAILFAVGAVGTALAPNVSSMVFFRVILGLAVGGASCTVPLYIAEISPSNRRGQLVTIQEFMIVFGQLLAYVSNWGLHHVWGGDSSWRWMLAIATFPAVLLWLGMLFLPETPRWYAMRGRVADARKVLEKTRKPDDVGPELNEIEENINKISKMEKGGFKDLAVPWMRKVFLLGIGIAAIQQLTGVNALMYYAPTVLQSTGLDADAALFATMANGVISVIMTVVGIILLFFMGRRPMVLIGQIGCTCCLFFIVAVSVFLPPVTVMGEINYVRSYLVLLGMLMFLCFQQGFLSPVTWLLLAEIFPIRIRGLCMGSAVLSLWCTNFLISLVFPSLLNAFGISGAFLSFACVGVFGGIFVIKCIPETKGYSLEKLEHFFREKYSGKADVRDDEALSTIPTA